MENCNCTCNDSCSCSTNQIVKIGTKVKNFVLPALSSDKKFIEIDFETSQKNNRWLIVYFYPLDFTFVCPTEIRAMSKQMNLFNELKTDVISISTDSVYSHLAWVNSELGSINHPMASDSTLEVSKYFNVLTQKGIAMRGLFLISPEGIVEHMTINNGEVGRSIVEELRTLQAYQAGGMAPCEWQNGDDLL